MQKATFRCVKTKGCRHKQNRFRKVAKGGCRLTGHNLYGCARSRQWNRCVGSVLRSTSSIPGTFQCRSPLPANNNNNNNNNNASRNTEGTHMTTIGCHDSARREWPTACSVWFFAQPLANPPRSKGLAAPQIRKLATARRLQDNTAGSQ